MRGRSGSTSAPGVRTTSPLTVTRPARINSSPLRREAIPAAAISFCNLCTSAHSQKQQTESQQAPEGPEPSQAKQGDGNRPLRDQGNLAQHPPVFFENKTSQNLSLANRGNDL